MAALVAAVVAPAPLAAAQTVAALPEDLTELSLDQLLSIEVLSVSKRAEPLQEAAAAIYVVTGEDLRRSGARTLADALRLVPGLHVQKRNAQDYSVSARGFGGDKLEVLMDGRSVYSPLTSSVFWDVLDTHLPDVQRIEVIRGPGATLWGANAMNGVINVVTASARDLSGTDVVGATGNEEQAFASLRTAESLGPRDAVSFFAKAYDRDSSHRAVSDPVQGEARDGIRLQRGGARYDHASEAYRAMVGAGIYRGTTNSSGVTANPVHGELSGGHVQVENVWRTRGGTEWEVGAFFDHYKRDLPEIFLETRSTYDLDLQNTLEFGDGNTFIWGAGYRFTRDETGPAPLAVIFSPSERTLETWSLFAQDQMSFGRNLDLTIGSKFEHNDFTGFEIQPGVRLGWQPAAGTATWASVSRAVRTPNRLDSDIAIFCSAALEAGGFCTPAGATLSIGNPDLESEKLIAYEAGVRWWLGSSFNVDVAAFLNDYTDLRSTETTPPPFGSFDNGLEGESYGGELALAWLALDWLELRPHYAYLKLDLRARGGSTDMSTARNLEGGSPEHAAGLRITATPWTEFTAGTHVRWQSALRAVAVPAYAELDLRLAWKPWPSLELALVGQNLLDHRHPESGSNASTTAAARSGIEIERSGLLELRWSLP